MKTTAMISVLVLLPVTASFGQTKEAWVDQLAIVSQVKPKHGYAWQSKKQVIPSVETPRPATNSALQKGPLRTVSADPRSFVYIGNGRWRYAIPQEEEAILRKSQARYRKVLEGIQFVRSHELTAARKALTPLVRADPTNEMALVGLAEVALYEGRYDEALALLGPIVQTASNNDTLLMAAVAGAMSGYVFEGQKEFTNRLVSMGSLGGDDSGCGLPVGNGLAPSRASSFLALAMMYSGRGDDWGSSTYYRRALEIDPSNPLASFGLGRILGRAGKWQEAAQVYAKGLPRARGTLKELALQDLNAAKYRAGKR